MRGSRRARGTDLITAGPYRRQSRSLRAAAPGSSPLLPPPPAPDAHQAQNAAQSFPTSAAAARGNRRLGDPLKRQKTRKKTTLQTGPFPNPASRTSPAPSAAPDPPRQLPGPRRGPGASERRCRGPRARGLRRGRGRLRPPRGGAAAAIETRGAERPQTIKPRRDGAGSKRDMNGDGAAPGGAAAQVAAALREAAGWSTAGGTEIGEGADGARPRGDAPCRRRAGSASGEGWATEPCCSAAPWRAGGLTDSESSGAAWPCRCPWPCPWP